MKYMYSVHDKSEDSFHDFTAEIRSHSPPQKYIFSPIFKKKNPLEANTKKQN